MKPNSAFLTECDPRNDAIINEVWSKRADAFLKCKEIQEYLQNNDTLYIEWENK